MKKTVEIEYVGIEDVQEILDDAYAVMREGHYVSVSVSNVAKDILVSVNIILGGFDAQKEFDYMIGFYVSEDENDVSEMGKCKSVLKSLLAEE